MCACVDLVWMAKCVNIAHNNKAILLSRPCLGCVYHSFLISDLPPWMASTSGPRLDLRSPRSSFSST
jgi:hypothetical protein